MTGSMRTVDPNVDNVDNADSNHMMMGGKRRRSKGSMKSKKSKKSRRARSSRRRSVKKGGMGMGMGFGAVLREAIVPFGLFALQKKSHKRRDDKRSFRKFKSQRRR